MNETTGFKDHFSRQSADYARYRPTYPPALIDFVAGLAPHRGLAVDCATGSGQAAIALAAHFHRVVAVDASAAQLASAAPHPRVEYLEARAEVLPVEARSVALVAVAQALHWFDADAFHRECRRVLAPGGVVAAWAYETFQIREPLAAIVDRFYRDTLGPYWPAERCHVESGYRTLSFPWPAVEAPSFTMEADWRLDELLGYLGSWSAVQRYRAATGRDPIDPLRAELSAAWPVETTVRLTWPVHLRIGRA